MARKGFMWGVVLVAFAVLGSWDLTHGGKGSSAQVGIPPETVADYVHAVIEADRTFYTIHVVERLQNRGTVIASENWRAEGSLPLQAQFLRESGELAALTGARLRYRLTGLWPINKQNGPPKERLLQGTGRAHLNPMVAARWSGTAPPRVAVRSIPGLLFHEPPRTQTRATSLPTNSP